MTIRDWFTLAGSLFAVLAILEWLAAWFQENAEDTFGLNVASQASALIAFLFYMLALMKKFGV